MAELRARVRELEEQVQELRARLASSADDDVELVPIGPHERWIEAHLDELRRYPDTWVLLDPDEGIVFHTKDEAAFMERLAGGPPEDRDRLMPFNTRMYV